MRFFINIEDDAGSSRRVPIDQLGLNRWSSGGGVSRSRVRKLIRQNRCCPPATSQLASPVAVGASEDLVVMGLSLVGQAFTLGVIADPVNPAAVLPTILSSAIAAGAGADDPDSLTVTLDTSGTGAGGEYILTITNRCGCCNVVPFTVGQD